MSKELLQVPSTIEGIKTRRDNTLAITVGTQELDPEDEAKIFSLRNRLGWFFFKEERIKEEDIKDLPEIEPEFSTDKPPSLRLRNVIFRYWEKLGKKGEFNDFYKKHIERLIDQYKEKLN